MAARSDGSAALGRLGRAAPTASEMELLRAGALDDGRAEDAWRRWALTHPIDDTDRYPVELLSAVSSNLADDRVGGDAGRLRGLRRRSWADSQARSNAVGGAVEALRSAGAVPVVTAGAVLATTVFEPGVRPWGRVDLVLGDAELGDAEPGDADPGGADLDNAARVLGSAGWTRVRDASSPFEHGVDLVDHADRLVRLHRWLLFPDFVDEPERQWWQRSVPHLLGSCAVSRFRMSDELVAVVLHGLLGDVSARARWPLDVVQLSRHAPSVDGISAERFWREVVSSAAEFAVGPLVADAVRMCRVELDAPVPAEVVDELAAGELDRHLGLRWALCRRGIRPEWRPQRYRRVCRERGARPTAWGYVRARRAALAARGVGPATRDRLDRAKRVVADRRRS